MGKKVAVTFVLDNHPYFYCMFVYLHYDKHTINLGVITTLNFGQIGNKHFGYKILPKSETITLTLLVPNKLCITNQILVQWKKV